MTPLGDLLFHGAPTFVSYGRAMLVQSSLLILILLAADVLLRHRVRPAIRYAVWMLALVKLLLPPTLASPTSPAYWLAPPLASPVPVDRVLGYAPVPLTRTTAVLAGGGARGASVTAVPATSADRTIDRMSHQLGRPSLPAALFTIWMGGVLVLGAWIIRAGRAARRLVALADPPPDDLRGLVDECRRELGVTRSIEIRCTSFTRVPAILGAWRPVILVPTPLLASLTAAQMRAVLLHEVAHTQRGDVWVACVQAIVQVVHWFNPLVWVANAVIRQVREQAVDDVVLVHMGETPEVYSDTLLHVARGALASPHAPVAGVAILERGTGLRRRITRMLARPAPSTIRVGIGNGLMIGVLALTVLPMAPRAAIISAPGALCLGTPPGLLLAYGSDFPAYELRRTQWLSCVDLHSGDVNVIEQAGNFLESLEPDLARGLFERARALDPDNSRWISKLAMHRLNRRRAAAGQDIRQVKQVERAVALAERALAQGRPCENVRPSASGPVEPFAYRKFREQWLACVASRPLDVSIVGNAAAFFSRRDRSLARELFERARALEPQNAHWTSQLSLLERLPAPSLEAWLALPSADRAARALQQAEEVRANTPFPNRFLAISLPQLAFEAGDITKARAYAEQLVAEGTKWDAHWAMRAVNQSNVVLGRVAMREGRRSDALEFLRRAGDLSGALDLEYSPGPNMSLARDLLQAGETVAVLAYFEQCRKFWVIGEELLDIWGADVRTGRLPHFSERLG